MSWREGMQIAEASAWAEHGRKHSTFYVWRPLILPGVIVLAMAGLGYGAYRAWSHLADGAAGHGGGIPVLMWVLLGVLVIGSIFAVKGTGRARPFGALVAITFAVGAAWLLWLGALISMLT